MTTRKELRTKWNSAIKHYEKILEDTSKANPVLRSNIEEIISEIKESSPYEQDWEQWYEDEVWPSEAE